MPISVRVSIPNKRQDKLALQELLTTFEGTVMESHQSPPPAPTTKVDCILQLTIQFKDSEAKKRFISRALQHQLGWVFSTMNAVTDLGD